MKKNSNKKWSTIFVLGLLAVSLAGCQGKSIKTADSSVEKPNDSTEQAVVETAVDWPYYEIKKNDKVVGHMLGTMHIGKKEMYPFPNEMLADVAASSLLVTEIKMKDLLEPDTDMLMAAIQGDKSITEGMTETSLKLFRKRLAEYGYDEEDLDQLNRFGVDQLLQTKYFSPIAATYGVEMQLYGKAKKMKGLKNIGLETIEEQYDILLSTYDELGDVNEWVNLIPTLAEGKADSVELMTAYMTGEVFDYFSEENMSELEKQQMSIIIDQRNANWLKVLPTYLDVEKGVFVAVGTGHLPGENGMLAMLESKGYETTKVSFGK